MLDRAKILLVEDEAPKREHIERLIRDLNGRLDIVTARSVNSALDVLETVKLELMLLDMSLPTFDAGDREGGGRPQGFGGVEILRMMKMAEIACPVIILTGYEGFAREGGEDCRSRPTATGVDARVRGHSELGATLQLNL